MGSFSVVVHEQGARSRSSFSSLSDALDAVAAEVGSRFGTVRDTAQAFARSVEPAEQVVARVEVHGPGGVHGGVDLLGDGEARAFTGRWIRRPVDPLDRETAPQALRRALRGQS